MIVLHRRRIGIAFRDRLRLDIRRWAETGRRLLGLIKAGGVGFPRECNICGFSGYFFPAGFPSGLTVRLDAGCPSCGSLERHRLIKLWLDGHESRLRERSILHFAPEQAVRQLVEKISFSYMTADLHPDRGVHRVLDIEHIDIPDHQFGAVICSHVLEHVDDRKALAELYRILSPGGLLLVMVPIIESWPSTYENPMVTTERDRLLYFGQRDHVRFYGADFRQRVKLAGFEIETFTAQEPEVSRFGLLRGETLFLCQKPAS